MSPVLYVTGIIQICLFIFSIEMVRSTTSPFNLTVKLTAESEVAIQAWMKRGSKLRLNIDTTFAKELHLPREAYLCPQLPGSSQLPCQFLSNPYLHTAAQPVFNHSSQAILPMQCRCTLKMSKYAYYWC